MYWDTQNYFSGILYSMVVWVWGHSDHSGHRDCRVGRMSEKVVVTTAVHYHCDGCRDILGDQ